MMKNFKKRISLFTMIVLVTVLVTSNNVFFQANTAEAAIDNTSDTLSRTAASTASNHTILFRANMHITNGGTITITFPAGFNLSAVTSVADYDFAIEITGSMTEQTVEYSATPTGSNFGIQVSGQSIVIETGPTAHLAQFSSQPCRLKIGTHTSNGGTGTHQIVNPTANTYTISLTSSAGETGSFQVTIATDDQVAVNATVDEILNFSVAQSTVSFGTIVNTARWATNAGGSGTEAAASTLTAGTNANGGLVIAVKSTGGGGGAGLYSAGAAKRIVATGPSTASGELYSFYSATVGSLTVLAGFLSGGTTALTTGDVTFANSGSAPIADTNLNIYLKAQKIDTTPAGTYTDTLTFTCTATY